MARYTKRYTSVRLEDNAGAGITVTPMSGDYSGGGENDSNVEKVRVLNRGAFDGIVETDDMTQDVTFTAEMENKALTDAVVATLTDFIKKQGSFSGATSVDPDVWAFKVIVTFNDGTTSTTKTYPYCVGTISTSEGDPSNTFSFSITNFQAPTDA